MKVIYNSEGMKKALKTKRTIDHDITMRKLAKQLGVSLATVSRAEEGKMVDLLTYVKLCRWLNEPLDKFIK